MKWLLTILIVIHLLIVCGNTISVFLLPFYTPFYIALPIITSIIHMVFAADLCTLTKAENLIRRRMGLPQIKGFIIHYLVLSINQLYHLTKDINTIEHHERT